MPATSGGRARDVARARCAARDWPSALATREPARPARRTAPRCAARSARRCTSARNVSTTTIGRAPSPNATSATSDEQAGATPPRRGGRRRCRAGRRAPCGSARCARRDFTVELRARERADGDRREVRMRVEVLRSARASAAVIRVGRRCPPGSSRSAGSTQKPDAVAEQRLVVPRALDGEQAHEHAHPRERRDVRRRVGRGIARRGGASSERQDAGARPPARRAKYHRAPRARVEDLPHGARGHGAGGADDDGARQRLAERPEIDSRVRDAERAARRRPR